MLTRFTKPELPRTLRRHFPNLEEKLLDEMAAAGEIVELREGQPVMQPGQQFRHMIFVLEGSIKIFREDEEGNEFYMYSLTSGTSCALSMSCSDKFEMSAVKGVTLEEGAALVVPNEYMEKWLPRFKSWDRFVVNTLRERIEDLLVTFDQVAFRSLDERLEFYLKRQQKLFDSDVLPLSHQQIATDLNTSREVISRLLKKLEQRGVISMQRNAVAIVKW